MKRKLRQYEVFKISVNRLVDHSGKKTKILPLTITKREALENGEVVKIQSNQLTNKIFDFFSENNIAHSNLDLSGIIINVYVPTDSKKQGEKDYATIAKKGFTVNGAKFVRLFSGSGQIRRNTITFIREDLYKPIFESLLCGLELKDFGDQFNGAKFAAYSGLNMSGCHLLPDTLTPNVCVVDDFEQIRPHKTVNYVTEQEVQYIALADEDYIITDIQSDYNIDGDKAVRKSNGKSFTIHKGVKKHIEQKPYDEIDGSPALNSFDGQGLMSTEWAEKVKEHLGLDYLPSALIVRAPWVKGLLANIPFHEWFYNNGITEIKDSFGKVRRVEDIDVIISKSQFKMHKIYFKKCEKLGVNAWNYYCQQMKANHLLWGIAKLNNAIDDDYKTFNYQYLQALQLDNEDIDNLCKPTEEFLTKLNSGDIEIIYNNLLVNGGSDTPDDENILEESENQNYKKLFQKIIEANPDFLNDKYVRSLILKECETKFNGAKLGKILVGGNFQFCISDPIAQLEWIAQNHCNKDMQVQGVVGESCVYSNYWLNKTTDTREIVLMRSPLIDRNEIAKRKLLQNPIHYFRYLASGIVYSIHDLTALQQGGCDFDGDITFTTNDPIVLKGSMSYEQANPLYYELSTTDLVGKITDINIIKADVRGLNSKVGKISNKAGSLYAKLEKYSPDSTEYKKIYDSIVALGQVVGMEIDRIKTAVAPTEPLEWKPLQITRFTDMDFNEVEANNEEEKQGIMRHNELIPDLKPYYFRYNYDYISKSINDLKREFNKVCEYSFGFKIEELKERVLKYAASEDEVKLWEQYQKAYPVIDTDCIVNHISHFFENFERNIKRVSVSEGRNMLSEYVSETVFDDSIINRATTIISEYVRFKRLNVISVKSKLTENKKAKVQKSFEVNDMMTCYFKDRLFDLANGDLQLAFDLIVKASNGNEKLVWDIMGESVIDVIKVG